MFSGFFRHALSILLLFNLILVFFGLVFIAYDLE
ncbi:hypothetical protein GLYMA_01G121051v4 [Glycine max]|nr:hypothetical protein GLYMA_01G121051v4 [Glycine max]KAH1162754.1 hypothetical protein GYH30_001306 [Glycine max]